MPLDLLTWPMDVAMRGIDVPHWVVVHSVDGVEPGVYRWPDLTSPLPTAPVETSSLRDELERICLGQSLGAEAAYVVISAADPAALDDRTYRDAQLAAGLVEGRLHLAAYALGISASRHDVPRLRGAGPAGRGARPGHVAVHLRRRAGVPQPARWATGRAGDLQTRDPEDGGRPVTKPTDPASDQPTHRDLIDALSWPVTTERLSIRPAEVGDSEAVWSYRRLPEVYEWMTTIYDDYPSYAEKFDDPEWRSRMLVIELDGRVIGDLYVAVEDAWSQTEVKERAVRTQAEIGWGLHPDQQGQGYAVEAVRGLLGICFGEPPHGLGLRRVIALCFADNEPSWRLMEKVRMRREAHLVKESLHREQGWLDGYTYGLLADEWRSS